jgi:hypothetical protein
LRKDGLVTEKRRIEYVRLSEIVGAPSNPKLHNKIGITKSIVHFGFTSPLLLDERTGRIVAGHGRLEALLSLRDDPGLMARLSSELRVDGGRPAGIAVGDDGEWMAPVARGWSSVNDAEASAYLVADNKLSEGGWDSEELARLLDNLEDSMLVDLTGVDLDELGGALDHMPDEGDADVGQVDTVWGIIVRCASEDEQVALLDRLSGEGLDVRALM